MRLTSDPWQRCLQDRVELVRITGSRPGPPLAHAPAGKACMVCAAVLRKHFLCIGRCVAVGGQLNTGDTEGTLQHNIPGCATGQRSWQPKGCPCLFVISAHTRNNDQQTAAARTRLRGTCSMHCWQLVLMAQSGAIAQHSTYRIALLDAGCCAACAGYACRGSASSAERQCPASTLLKGAARLSLRLSWLTTAEQRLQAPTAQC